MWIVMNQKNGTRVVAYCRVSTDKDDQLDSLEAQEEFFSGFIKQHNYNFVKIYADEGLHGRQIKKRDEFNRMMRDARRGMFDMLLVKDISRFARNTVDLLNSVRELKAMRIEVQFITNNYKSLRRFRISINHIWSSSTGRKCEYV
jgi:DNA invertase Pin-like site-specific DNA recombinase